MSLPSRNYPIITIAGFLMTAGQVILIRRTLALSGGDEIAFSLTLLIWLLTTSLGSYLSSRIYSRTQSPLKILKINLILLAVALPGSLFTLHYLCRYSGWISGTLPGGGALFLPLLAAITPLGILSGSLFPQFCRLLSGQFNHPVTRTYLFEAVGSLIAGVSLALVFLPFLTGFTIACFLCLWGLMTVLLYRYHHFITWLPLLTALGITALFFNATRQVDHYLFQLLRPQAALTEVLETPYGVLETTDYNGQIQIYENGLTISVSDDLPDAEEKSHLFLAQHPSPEQVLWVGGALGGGVEQALRHPSLKKLDVIELNPLLLKNPLLFDSLKDNRVHYLIGDGRSIIRQSSPESYDLIVLQLPGPRTIRLSKYYTVEFFREVERVLKPAGVFGFAIASAGDYIGAETASLLATLRATLQEVFPQVDLLPGPHVLFIAAKAGGHLAPSYQQISARLQARSIAPLYWDSYRLKNRLSPSRIQALQDAIANAATQEINTDAVPASFFLQQVIWSRQVRAGLADLMIWFKKSLAPALLIILVIASLVSSALTILRKQSRALVTNWTVMTAGFSAIALEILCLIGYQIHFGSGYREVGLLLGLYMAGLALGGVLALKCRSDSINLARIVQMTLVAFPLIFLALFSSMPDIVEKSPALGRGLYSLFMLCIGVAGGLQFLFMVRLKSAEEAKASGFLYALDLLGAALGAALIGLLTIPILGIWITASGLVWLNALPLLLLLSLPFRALGSSA